MTNRLTLSLSSLGINFGFQISLGIKRREKGSKGDKKGNSGMMEERLEGQMAGWLGGWVGGWVDG